MMNKIISKGILLLFELLKIQFRKKTQEKILIVAEYAEYGGTRTYFISLLHFLKKEKGSVTVLINSQLADTEISNLIDLLGFQVIHSTFDFWCTDFSDIPSGLTKKALWIYQVNELLMWCRLIRKNKFKKIIFSVGYPEQYLYTFLLPVQIIYILHTEPVKKIDKYKNWILQNKLSKKKQILTVSKSSKMSIEKKWLKNKKNLYVNFIHNYYEPLQCTGHTISNIKQNRILTIGSVESYKNPFFFIKCAKQVLDIVKDSSIIFTWAGDGSLLEECKELIKGNQQIEFIGYQTNVEILYKSSSIYFQPSLQESHGIAVVGAMCNKLPCIVSDFGGLKESVINNKTGFVIDIDNPEQAVKLIIELLKDSELSHQMGIEGYQFYSHKFTKEHWQAEMQNFFNYV